MDEASERQAEHVESALASTREDTYCGVWLMYRAGVCTRPCISESTWGPHGNTCHASRPGKRVLIKHTCEPSLEEQGEWADEIPCSAHVGGWTDVGSVIAPDGKTLIKGQYQRQEYIWKADYTHYVGHRKNIAPMSQFPTLWQIGQMQIPTDLSQANVTTFPSGGAIRMRSMP